MKRAGMAVSLVVAASPILYATAVAQTCTTMQYGWTHTFGADGEDWGRSIGVGENGEIYLGGFFEGRVDFDSSPTKTDWHQSNGWDDSFYTFYDPDGRHRWTGTVGGISFDGSLAAHVSSDRFWVGGSYRGSVDLNPKRKEDIHVGSPVFSSAYLTCLGTDRRYYWSRTIEADGFSAVRGAITADSVGNVISAGVWSKHADFNPEKREDTRVSVGGNDAFVWMLDPRGKYVWAHTFGGVNRDEAHDVTVGLDDNIYCAGVFMEEVDFDPRGKGDVHQGPGLWDAFLTSLSPKGRVRWSWTMGSAENDEVWGVAVGPDGRVYGTGYFSGSADFDARGKGDIRKPQGGTDGFLTMFEPNGRYLGTFIMGGSNGTGAVLPRAMAVDHQRGIMVIGGDFSGTVDFDPGAGVDAKTSNGSLDAFVVLLTLRGEHVESFTFGGENQDGVDDVQFDPGGSLLVTGFFQSISVDLDPCEGQDIRQRVGTTWPDGYLSKYLCGNCK